MSKVNDVKNAFPIPIITTGSINDSEYALNELREAIKDAQGMTLRDWFAGQALAGISEIMCSPNHGNEDLTACMCYAMADAMLSAREA